MTRPAGAISEIERLARQLGARFTLEIDYSTQVPSMRAMWKAPRQRAERVNDYGPTATSERVLDVLVTRLGFARLPTTESILSHMTDAQVERARELVTELRLIKMEALRRIEDVEPFLASPRSSLHPDLT